MAIDHLAIHHDLLDTAKGRQVEHRVQQDAFHDGAQATGPGLARDRLARDRYQGLIGKGQLDISMSKRR